MFFDRSKRLCERWLDNLFMLLYEDLKTYTDWQSEQLYFDAQNSKYHKLTVEWELFGLCAKRLGHLPEAAKAFQIGLSQRFSPVCAKNLLQFYIDEHKRIRRDSVSANSELTSSQILSSINDIDSSIIDRSIIHGMNVKTKLMVMVVQFIKNLTATSKRNLS